VKCRQANIEGTLVPMQPKRGMSHLRRAHIPERVVRCARHRFLSGEVVYFWTLNCDRSASAFRPNDRDRRRRATWNAIAGTAPNVASPQTNHSTPICCRVLLGGQSKVIMVHPIAKQAPNQIKTDRGESKRTNAHRLAVQPNATSCGSAKVSCCGDSYGFASMAPF
jgi:hypothetical protein